MAKYNSNRQQNLKIGISSYTESKTVLEVTGKVGIGTTDAQSYELFVNGDINFEGTLNQNGALFVASRWTAGTGDDIYRLTGNVGIGTTHPTAKFEVLGDGYFVGIGTTNIKSTLEIYGNGTYDYNAITLSGSSLDNLTGKGSIIRGARYNNSNIPFTAFGTWDDGSGRYAYIGGGGWDVPESTDILFYTGNYVEDVNSSPLRLRIDSDGNVIIGGASSTGTTNQKLQVNSGAYISGNIGIGTTIPNSSLEVLGKTIITNPNASSLDLRSGSIDAYTSFNIGRTEQEATFAIPSNAGDWIPTSNPGDLVIRTEREESRILMGIDTNLPAIVISGNNVEISGVTTSLGGFVGNLIGTATSADVATYATLAGIATYADNAGISTSVIGGIASVTQLSVSGISTLGTVEISSGIVTATSGSVIYYGNQVIGTPSGGFKIGAFTINNIDFTKDSINELNFILGKLVPKAPTTISGASLILSGTTTGRLCSGFTPTNNTGGDLVPSAGTQYSRNTDNTIATSYLTEYGPGDSGTVTAYINAVGVGTTTLSVGSNNGTYGFLQIANDKDASLSSRNPGITSQFYEVYDSRILDAPCPDGFNKAYIQQNATITQNAFWYEDPSTVTAPVLSIASTSAPTSPTLSYSSGVPHYTQSVSNGFSYIVTCLNATGDLYTTNTFMTSGGQTTGFQDGGSKSYTDFASGTNPPVRNYGVGTGVTCLVSQIPRDVHDTVSTDSTKFSLYTATTPYGSGTARATITQAVNIMGTTAITNKVDEDNILITTLGTGSGNAIRTNAGSSADNPTPVYTSWNASTTAATYEAIVRGGVLRHDQTNYSTGYFPVGPDYSSSRSGAQYFQVELIRSNVSQFRISITGSYAGCWVTMPNNSTWTTSLSGTNGWANMFQSYRGSGVPTTAEPGCASGGVMSGSSGTFTCVFGTESSSNDSNNRILVRIRLNSGQSITTLSFSNT